MDAGRRLNDADRRDKGLKNFDRVGDAIVADKGKGKFREVQVKEL
jgi:hypothetical protein